MNILGKFFQNRAEAGRQLARSLFTYTAEHPVILALPRGGVPVGYEIAALLHAQLDVIVVRKIKLPDPPELGIGAVAEGDVHVFEEKALQLFGITKSDLDILIRYETSVLNKRVMKYRKTIHSSHRKDRTVIIVDDGLATGVTARAAILSVKKQNPKKIIFASPVCAYDPAVDLRSEADDVFCLSTPHAFTSVGMWYSKFDQTTDEEVLDLLKKNRAENNFKEDQSI